MTGRVESSKDQSLAWDEVYVSPDSLIIARLSNGNDEGGEFILITDSLNVTVREDGSPVFFELYSPQSSWRRLEKIDLPAPRIEGRVSFERGTDLEVWSEEEELVDFSELDRTILIRIAGVVPCIGFKLSPRITVFLSSEDLLASILLTEVEFRVQDEVGKEHTLANPPG